MLETAATAKKYASGEMGNTRRRQSFILYLRSHIEAGTLP